jgi:KUP system potassium uptake protein
MAIRHTSEAEIGQIYVPSVNWALMSATLGLVLWFQNSDNLAAAYGVAVTTTMVITTLLFYILARERWRWPLATAVPLAFLFMVPDAAFFGANIIKVHHGGWVPLALASGVFTVLTTWKRGRSILFSRLQEQALPMKFFLEDVERNTPLRVPGTAVFMTGNSEGVPVALLHNLKHNHVLHEKVVLLTILSEEIPRVGKNRRLEAEDLGHGIHRLVARYGFMETPDVPLLLKAAAKVGLHFEMMKTTFFLGRETLVSTPRRGMARWRERLFALMSRNAQTATAYFGLPANRVVELGAHIEL